MGERWVDTSKTFVVHPDQTAAMKKYKPGSKTSLDEMFDERNQILEDGGEYWNPLHDSEFRETAEENTNNAITQKNWKFPQKRKR
jgi:hypothetical protein